MNNFVSWQKSVNISALIARHSPSVLHNLTHGLGCDPRPLGFPTRRVWRTAPPPCC